MGKCLPTYKGKRYNSLEELYRANGINQQQRQQAQRLYSQYLDSIDNLSGSKQDIEGFKEFVDSLNNPINNSIVFINRDAELRGITLKNNVYISDQNDIAKNFVINVKKILNKNNESEAVLSVLSDFIGQDMLGVLEEQNSVLNQKYDDNMSLSERIANGVISLANDKAAPSDGLINSFTEWLYNSNLIIDENIEHFSYLLDTPVNTSESIDQSVDNTENVSDSKEDSISEAERIDEMNNILLGIDRAKKTASIITAVMYDKVPYSNAFNLSSSKDLKEAVSEIYNELILGKVRGVKVIDSPITITRMIDGKEVSVRLKGKDITDEDITNNPFNTRLINKRNIYKAHQAAMNGDNELAIYIMTLGLNGVDVKKMLEKQETNDDIKEGARKNYTSDTNDISDYMTESIKYVLNNILIDTNDPSKGVFNGNEVVDFFKALRSQLKSIGKNNSSFYDLGQFLSTNIKNGLYQGKNKQIAKGIFEYFFEYSDVTVGDDGSFMTSVINYNDERNSIISEYETLFGDDTELLSSNLNKLEEKFYNMDMLVNNMTQWFNSIHPVQIDVINNEDGTVTTLKPFSDSKSTSEYKNAMKDHWGFGNIRDTSSMSSVVTTFFNTEMKIIKELDYGRETTYEFTITTPLGTFTFNPATRISESEDLMSALKFAMMRIGYSDINTYFDVLIAQKIDGKLNDATFEKSMQDMVMHILKSRELYNQNLVALDYIGQINEAYGDIEQLSNEDRMLAVETENRLVNEYRNKYSRKIPSDLSTYKIKLYTPIAYYNEFFKNYTKEVDKFSSLKISTMAMVGDGTSQSLYLVNNSFSDFTNQESIDEKFSNTKNLGSLEKRKERVMLNPIINGKFKVISTSQHGGATMENDGKKQNELDTVEFFQTYVNSYIKKAIFNAEKGNMNLFTFSNMQSDRSVIWMTEYDYTPNGLQLFTVDDRNIKVNKDAVVAAFNDIANIYKKRKDETVALYKEKKIQVIDGYLTFTNEQGEQQAIRKEDKSLYWGLINNYHYVVKKETSDIVKEDGTVEKVTTSYLTPGYSYTFKNSAIPASLITDKLTHDKIMKEYTENEVNSLISMFMDNEIQLTGYFSNILPSGDTVHKIVKESIAESNVNEIVVDKDSYEKAIIGVKQYRKSINELKNLSDNTTNESEMISVLSEINTLNESLEVLQKEISNYKKIFKKSLFTDKSRYDKGQALFEYITYSYLFYNTLMDDVTRDGSFHNPTITDFIKRAQGLTAPYLKPNTHYENGIGKKINIIYREDSYGSYLGTNDSELHSNGEVMFSPLFLHRFIESDGGDLSFASFNGQIKTNYFNSGVDTMLDPVYIKMSARTLSAFELKSLSKQAKDTLKLFFDKTIYTFNKTDLSNAGKINLYTKFESRFNNIKTQQQLRDLIRNIDKFVISLKGQRRFVEEKNIVVDDKGKISFIGATQDTEISKYSTLDLYQLLPHMIAPLSAAKMYQQKAHNLQEVETSNDEQFPYTLSDKSPMNEKANNVSSMAKSSSEGLGIQTNKNHSILPGRKPMPNQIINFTGIRDTFVYNNIITALAGMTTNSINELKALVAKGDDAVLKRYRNIAFKNAQLSGVHNSKLELIRNPNSVSVIQKELAMAITKEFKKAVKPDMVGGTFVQRASNIHVYRDENNHVFLANEVGAVDDYTDVDGFTRTRLRPFGYSYNGKVVKSKEELATYLSNEETKKGLKAHLQEVIMDFPYRKRFHIANEESLNDIMVINGVNFQDGDTILTKEEILNKVNELSNSKTTLTGDAKILGDVLLMGELVDLFKGNKFQYKYFTSKLETIETMEQLKNEIADYYIELNKALYVYPIRIPTTGLASGFPSKIVAFANGIENTIIVPSEKSILDGSDYDIDELHVLYKPFNEKWNKDTLPLQQMIFDSIFDTYNNIDNANEVLTEITYKDIVKQAEESRIARNDEQLTNRISDFPKTRSDLYDGEKMVGYEVNAQQALMNLYITRNSLKDSISLPFLDLKDSNGSTVGISVAVDVMSSFVNMATDNGKLGGLLGELGHDTSISTLVLGLTINGITDPYTSHEAHRLLLNARIQKVLSDPIILEAVRKAKKNNRITSSLRDITNVEELIYSTIETKIKQLSENQEDNQNEIDYYTEIKNALVIGIQSYRLSQLNMMQDKITSLYSVYNKKKVITKNIGATLDDFYSTNNITPEMQMSFIGSASSLEKDVRNVFNIVDYARKNKMVIEQVKLLDLLENTISQIIPDYKALKSMEDFYFGKTRNNSKANMLYEDKFNAMMNGIESIKVTNFIQTSPAYKNIVINFDNYNFNLDLSNYNDILKLHTVFPRFAENVKKNNIDNYFARQISLRSAGGNKQFVTVRNAESINDGGMIEDLQKAFTKLDTGTKKAFMVYAFLSNGTNSRRNGLIRFVDNSILNDYSRWDNENGNKIFDDLMKRGNIMTAIELANPKLQLRYNMEHSGYNQKPSYNTNKYSATYIDQYQNTYALRSPHHTKILSTDSISRNGRIVNLSIEQELELMDGKELIIDLGKTDVENTSFPRLSVEGNVKYNHTAFNTVKAITEGAKHKLIPITTNETYTVSKSSLGQELSTYFLSSPISEHVKTFIDKNGDILVGNDKEIMELPIKDIYGAINSLRSNIIGSDELSNVSKIAERVKYNTIFVQVYENTFGGKPTKKGAMAFITRNYNSELMLDAFVKANESKKLVFSNKELETTEQIKAHMDSLFSESDFNDIFGYVNHAVSTFVNSQQLPDSIKAGYGLDDIEKVTLINVARALKDSNLVQERSLRLYNVLNSVASLENLVNNQEADVEVKC